MIRTRGIKLKVFTEDTIVTKKIWIYKLIGLKSEFSKVTILLIYIQKWILGLYTNNRQKKSENFYMTYQYIKSIKYPKLI